MWFSTVKVVQGALSWVVGKSLSILEPGRDGTLLGKT